MEACEVENADDDSNLKNGGHTKKGERQLKQTNSVMMSTEI